MQPHLVYCLNEGMNEKEAFTYFKTLGFGEVAAKGLFKYYGVVFPKDYVYNELNPNPTRMLELQLLSIS